MIIKRNLKDLCKTTIIEIKENILDEATQEITTKDVRCLASRVLESYLDGYEIEFNNSFKKLNSLGNPETFKNDSAVVETYFKTLDVKLYDEKKSEIDIFDLSAADVTLIMQVISSFLAGNILR